MLAEIYLYGHQPEQRITYFKNAEESFIPGMTLRHRKIFWEYADCLKTLKN
jgi:hypothetical protein